MTKFTKTTILFLSLALALIAAGLFAYGAAQATPTATHCVNVGDKIQDAIDAANSGDIIQVVTTTTFVENLVIDKSLTLQGGWSPNCAYRTDSWHSTVDGNAVGRVVTIQPSSGVIDVEISQMLLFNGNATGRGGGPSVDAAVISLPGYTWPPVEGDKPSTPSVSEPAETIDWESRLAELHASGGFPGGDSAYQALVERFKSLLDQPEASAAIAVDRQPAAPPQWGAPSATEVSADCGGGVYVTGANLTLSDTLINLNVASTSGMGFGGGLCAVNLSGGRIMIGDDTQFHKNTASSGDIGVGGALFIHGSDSATVVLNGLFLRTNIASSAVNGWGGGAAIFNTPSLVVADSTVMWNEAGRLYDYTPGLQSIGGGLYIDACPDAEITHNNIFDNMADAGGAEGIAGGVFVYESPRAEVSQNRIARNTAHAQVGLRGPAGFGGGLVIGKSADMKVFENTIIYNLASLYAQGFGGGVYAGEVENLEFFDNEIEDNAAAYFPNGNQYGGGMILVKSEGVQIYNNSFKRNMAGTWAVGDHLGFAPGGGGLAVDLSLDVTIKDNNFEENTAMLAGFGNGGALFIGGTSHDITVENNTFHKNTGVRQEIGEDTSVGEGAAIGIDIADHIDIHRNTFTNNAGSLGSYIGSVVMSTHLLMGGDDYGGEDISIDGNQFLNNGKDLLPEGSLRTYGIRAQFTRNLIVINNVFANMTDAAVELEFPPSAYQTQPEDVVINNTFAGNEGPGVFLFGDWYQDDDQNPIQVINNIFSGHVTAIRTDSDNDLVVDHNLFHNNTVDLDGNLTATNTVTGDPKYLDPDLNNYMLVWGSPAINAGLSDPGGPTTADASRVRSSLPDHDLRLMHRPYGMRWDIGAHELMQWFFPISILN